MGARARHVASDVAVIERDHAKVGIAPAAAAAPLSQAAWATGVGWRAGAVSANGRVVQSQIAIFNKDAAAIAAAVNRAADRLIVADDDMVQGQGAELIVDAAAGLVRVAGRGQPVANGETRQRNRDNARDPDHLPALCAVNDGGG